MMDRVKAIEVLKPLVDSYVDHANITMKEEDDDIAEALEMAVEALRVLDVPDTNVGDMISRRVAIEALDEWFKKVRPLNMSAYEYDSAYTQGEIDAYVTAIDTLKTLAPVQPEPKWIPCSERLPEEGQKCLVCDKGGIGIDTYIGHGNPYNWKWYTRDYEAWQPLPEAYKEGGEQE